MKRAEKSTHSFKSADGKPIKVGSKVWLGLEQLTVSFISTGMIKGQIHFKENKEYTYNSCVYVDRNSAVLNSLRGTLSIIERGIGDLLNAKKQIDKMLKICQDTSSWKP